MITLKDTSIKCYQIEFSLPLGHDKITFLGGVGERGEGVRSGEERCRGEENFNPPGLRLVGPDPHTASAPPLSAGQNPTPAPLKPCSS